MQELEGEEEEERVGWGGGRGRGRRNKKTPKQKETICPPARMVFHGAEASALLRPISV
jgi:hypothetical protein